jgi:acyl-coenzyme A thioesterase PaaI-like protein
MIRPIQSHYPDEWSHCYGCGRLNEKGYHIQSVQGEAGITVCEFRPEPWHTALPGYVYGGLLASVIDCHATGTAAAHAHRLEEEHERHPYPRFVTASLTIDFLKPTPLAPFRVEGRILEHQGRRIVVACTVGGGAHLLKTVEARITVVRIPDSGWPATASLG